MHKKPDSMMSANMKPRDNQSNWPPEKNEMPDLSGLNDKLTLGLILNAFFRGAGPRDSNARALWTNYIRLVDQMIREYNSAHDSLQEYIDTPNNVMGPLFKCIGHMENYINSMRRAIRFARKMRRNPSRLVVGRLAVLNDNNGGKVINLRNAIEHLDKAILNDEIAEGQSHTLLVNSDSISLAGIEIPYIELAKWIRELHTLAKNLIDFHES